MPEKLISTMQLTTPPALTWASGTIRQILAQPGEKFYVFALRQTDGTTVFLRIGNAHTGHTLNSVSADNLIYDLLKEAYFRDLSVEVGYRDFGPDPQSGINNLVIDRVSITR